MIYRDFAGIALIIIRVLAHVAANKLHFLRTYLFCHLCLAFVPFLLIRFNLGSCFLPLHFSPSSRFHIHQYTSLLIKSPKMLFPHITPPTEQWGRENRPGSCSLQPCHTCNRNLDSYRLLDGFTW
jgi:hypothetical protein